MTSSSSPTPRSERSDTARRQMRSAQAGHTPWVEPTTRVGPMGNRTTHCFMIFWPQGMYNGPSLILLHQAHCVSGTHNVPLSGTSATYLTPDHLQPRVSRCCHGGGCGLHRGGQPRSDSHHGHQPARRHTHGATSRLATRQETANAVVWRQNAEKRDPTAVATIGLK